MAEIEREALSVLKPFAAYADWVDQHHPGWAHDGFAMAGFEDLWRYSDFVRARNLVAKLEAALASMTVDGEWHDGPGGETWLPNQKRADQ